MKNPNAVALSAALSVSLVLSFSCASSGTWRIDEGLAAEKIELQVGAGGEVQEIEYHVRPGMVPDAVRDAMDSLHPGGRATGAEKEYIGSTLYWEVTKQIDGRYVEAMFLADGSLHSEEVEVAQDAVPAAVKRAVANHMSGRVNKWEEIRDHSRTLVEYHVKLTSNGADYKLAVSPDGVVRQTFREVAAEIELPVH
jgi:hypothetical protein